MLELDGTLIGTKRNEIPAFGGFWHNALIRGYSVGHAVEQAPDTPAMQQSFCS
jgi:hypothetical protein